MKAAIWLRSTCLALCATLAACATPAPKPAGLDLPYTPNVPMQIVVLAGGRFSVDGQAISCADLRLLALHRMPTELVAMSGGSIVDILCLASIAAELGVRAYYTGSDGNPREIKGHL